METRAVVSGALGSALEYFDFAVYGALSATLFPALFFSDLGSTGALLASFATFGVGFVARPVGAVVFGHLGDKFGRKPILFTTLMLMGGSSILIGALPTGKGFAIAALLVGLRFIQGFSLGGESIGNQLMTMEHGDKSRRGLLGSFITMGSPISQVMANMSLVILSAVLTTEQFESWGWRIPFFGSILVVGVAVVIRLKLEETPAFVANHETATPAEKHSGGGLRVLVTHPGTVAKLTLSWGGPALAFYLVAVYGISYLSKEAGMSRDTSFILLIVGNGVSVVACVVGGWLADRLGRKAVMTGGIVGAFVGIALFFTIAGSNVVVTGLILTLVLSSVQFLSGAQPAFFAEQFPTESRFSGAALGHTFANLIFSAPSPFIAAALASIGGTNLVMFFTLAVLLVSVIAVSQLQDGRHLDLEEFTDRELPKADLSETEEPARP
jgi:MFS family permease